MTTSAGEQKLLKELDKADADEWCRARWAVAACYSLGMTHDEVNVFRRKLQGRRCQDVRATFQILKTTKPENRSTILTKFAKTHKEIRGKAA